MNQKTKSLTSPGNSLKLHVLLAKTHILYVITRFYAFNLYVILEIRFVGCIGVLI